MGLADRLADIHRERIGLQFEYQTLVVPGTESELEAVERLNSMGKDGWQLVHISLHPSMPRLWLMREMQKPE